MMQVSLLLSLLACFSQDPTQAPAAESVIDPERLDLAMDHLPKCGAYRQDEDTFSYCVARSAHGLENTQVCAAAGAQERACHLDWVSARLRNPKMTPELLLQECGPAQDCALMVLDAYPRENLAAHADACADRAGPFANDCINHAGRRWVSRKPTPQAQGALNELPNKRPDLVGFWVGVAQACMEQELDCSIADQGEPFAGNAVACPNGYGQARDRPGQWCAMQVEN